MAELSTLCYLERDGQYLMLHRTVKKNDVNRDKWIGVGLSAFGAEVLALAGAAILTAALRIPCVVASLVQ